MDAEHFPVMTFTSTRIRLEAGFVVDGDLTIKGVTKPVVLQATVPQFGASADGGTSLGVSAHTSINRSEFGVDFNIPIPGGWMVGEDIQVLLEVEADLKQ
jgi:polyisoprenoid-binding protein YceI